MSVVGYGIKLSIIGVVRDDTNIATECKGQKSQQPLREPTKENKSGEIVLNSDDQRQNSRIFVSKVVRGGQI